MFAYLFSHVMCIDSFLSVILLPSQHLNWLQECCSYASCTNTATPSHSQGSFDIVTLPSELREGGGRAWESL